MFDRITQQSKEANTTWVVMVKAFLHLFMCMQTKPLQQALLRKAAVTIAVSSCHDTGTKVFLAEVTGMQNQQREPRTCIFVSVCGSATCGLSGRVRVACLLLSLLCQGFC